MVCEISLISCSITIPAPHTARLGSLLPGVRPPTFPTGADSDQGTEGGLFLCLPCDDTHSPVPLHHPTLMRPAALPCRSPATQPSRMQGLQLSFFFFFQGVIPLRRLCEPLITEVSERRMGGSRAPGQREMEMELRSKGRCLCSNQRFKRR